MGTAQAGRPPGSEDPAASLIFRPRTSEAQPGSEGAVGGGQQQRSEVQRKAWSAFLSVLTGRHGDTFAWHQRHDAERAGGRSWRVEK